MMRILWAFDIKPAANAKLPLNIADWRGDFPGLAGERMPVSMIPRDEIKINLLDQAFKVALAERPDVVCRLRLLCVREDRC